MPDGIKERLLNHTLLLLSHGHALSGLAGLPHGLTVLSGPPGTGKTSLARGLAQVAAQALAHEGATTYAEIDPHAFPSEMLGESQRNIVRLMSDTLPELAARRPHTVVLVDEVEALAVRRSSASLASNPVDIHRATDALLLGLDTFAATHPKSVLVVTTNFPDGVDEAFLSQADLVVNLRLPDEMTAALILRHALAEVAQAWPAMRHQAEDDALHRKLAQACAGWDGRRLRKLVLLALAMRREVALNPGELIADDLHAALAATC